MENPLPDDSVENPRKNSDEIPEDEPKEEPIEQPEEEFGETADVPKEERPKRLRSRFSVVNAVQTVFSVALVMATLLTLWNPRKMFNTPSLASLVEAGATQSALEAEQKAQEESVQHIGILAGHWEDNDPGEVCSDGTIESDVNEAVATLVVQKLEDLGYTVDLFPEYDLNMLNYEGAAFVAIYSGSCADNPPPPSGFSIGGNYAAQNPEVVDQLATCLAQEYQKATNLPFTYEVINAEDPTYHVFRDISTNTPAVRLKMGSLNTDRKVLLNQSQQVADGIVAGIQCFLGAQ